jgi:hypothetical protein
MAIEPDTLLTRDKAAEALTAAGFPIRKATLATLACRGNSPPFQKFGSRPLYRWSSLIAWAEARCSPARCSTSEADAM